MSALNVELAQRQRDPAVRHAKSKARSEIVETPVAIRSAVSGAGLAQHCDAIEVIVLQSQLQRRSAAAIDSINLGTSSEQKSHPVGAAVQSRVMQHGQPVVIGAVNVDFDVARFIDRKVAVDHRMEQLGQVARRLPFETWMVLKIVQISTAKERRIRSTSLCGLEIAIDTE